MPLIPHGMWHERKMTEEVNGASERFGVSSPSLKS